MKRFAFCAFAFLICASCTDGVLDDNNISDSSGELSHDMIVLGKQLPDPYSVENMTKALATLYPTKAERVQVETTDYYVRFLPSDSSELEALESLGLEMLDHPMDYEIIREGDYYHDPQVPEDDITWQYAVVPVDFVFPDGVRYEKLDECCLTEHLATKADGIDWNAVEREAYILTGNAGCLSGDPGATKGGNEYDPVAPQGRITIMDELYDSEPVGVAGVRVSCNSFVKFVSAYTDEEGYYKMTRSYSTDIRYRLVFKNVKGFTIGFNRLLVPSSASTLGKHSPEGINLMVDRNSERKLFSRCVVNNAGYDYWESCSLNGQSMTAPPANLRIWLFAKLDPGSAVMLQQGAIVDGSVISDFLGEYTPLLKMFLPDVTIGLKDRDSYERIYSAAIHELAHATHFAQVGKDFWNIYIKYVLTSFVTSGGVYYGVGTEDNHGYAEVGEMWAYYVQTKLHSQRYPDSDAVYGTTYWFSPQIFMYLDERGIDRFKISKALTSDITSRDILQDKLISLYPESKSVINQAFARYL